MPRGRCSSLPAPPLLSPRKGRGGLGASLSALAPGAERVARWGPPGEVAEARLGGGLVATGHAGQGPCPRRRRLAATQARLPWFPKTASFQ